MENACWKCGDLFHHARECSAVDVDRNVKKRIQLLRFATGSSNRNNKNLETKMQLLKIVQSNQLPPVQLLKNEIGNQLQLLCDTDEKLDALDEITIDVDRSKEQLELAESYKTELTENGPHIRELGWIVKECKKEWNDDSEIELLQLHWYTLNDKQKTISNKAYKAYNDRKVAQTICKKIVDESNEIMSWLSSIPVPINGRPLELFDDHKKAFKLKKLQLLACIEKHGYLFQDHDKLELQTKMEIIQNRWRKIVSRDRQIEYLKLKISCILCEDEEKRWVLRCGHAFCNACMEQLERDRAAEGIPFHIEGTNRIIPGADVAIQKCCPFCREALTGKYPLRL